jgi:hypothetical protein
VLDRTSSSVPPKQIRQVGETIKRNLAAMGAPSGS